MEQFFKEIVEKHKSDRYIREVYKFEDIEITVDQKGDKLVIWGFNNKSDRFLNLGTKKYSTLIRRFKTISKDLYSKDNKYFIILDAGIKSVENKIIGYARVSTKKQIDGNSLEQQLALITNRYPSAIVYEESKSSVKERKTFNKIIDGLNRGDILVVTTLDRFCRTVKEGLEVIDSLINKGVIIHILNMGLIEDTPMGRLIVTNLLAFAEFERAMIVERTQTGKAIAKSKEGWKEGRPKVYSKEQLDLALSMLTVNGGDKSYKEVERLLGISKSTLIRENNKRKV
ncbi:MAG: recombinase family protein [Veillonella sp.]|uniref:recombinase family protein n=1 Tax=Veillonella sp. TaxID=1926307 RepID=UPI0028FEFF19|nr:recombinase family protein [Veillonella sp.]MDU2702380.1 recombinase family protein [Veillonella sp.]